MIDLPPVFLSYQQELMSSTSLYPVVLVEKSRRTGYSWAAAAIAVTTAAAQRQAGGMSVYYMGYDHEMAREFIDYCGTWAKQLQAAAGEVQETFFTDPDNPEKQIKAFRVEFDSGFEIVALPSVPRALRGKQGLVIIDEAAFHSELKEVLKAAMALLMWGGRVLILSTHNGDENPFNALVQEVRAGKLSYHLLRCTLDDALEQGLYKRICLTLGKEWSPEAEAAWRADLIAKYGEDADEELFCIAREGGGKAIPRALIEKRMVVNGPVLRWRCDEKFVHLPAFIRTRDAAAWCEENLRPVLDRLDPDLPCVFGEDFARKKDLTVFLPAQITQGLVKRVPFIVELRNVPYDQQWEILQYMIDGLPRFRAGKLDAGGNGGFLAEKAMQRYGETRIECVQLTEPWYRENTPAVKAAFEDGTIELPPDRDVQDDIALAEYVRGVIRVPERVLGSDGEGRHGDSFIAATLMLAAARADVELYELELGPAGRREGQGAWQARYDELMAEDNVRPAPGGFLPDLQGGMVPRLGGPPL